MALIAITLIQVALGTQVRGGIDHALDAGVARGAALASVGTLDYLHRDAAFVVLVGAILLSFWLVAKRAASRLIVWGWAVLALAALQVVTGVVLAYVSLLPAAQVVHLTLASLLLGAQTVLLLLAGTEAAGPNRVAV